MSPEALAGLIAGAVSTVGSGIGIMCSMIIAGRWSGRIDVRVAMLEVNQDKLATREQLAGVKEDLAEIKGMFRMTPREAAV